MRFKLPTAFYGIVALAAISMQTGECLELLTLAFPEWEEGSTSITGSSDPAVRSAGDSDEAVDRGREIDELHNSAYRDLDVGAIDRAIALEPDANALRYDKVVLLVARGDEEQRINDAIQRAVDVSSGTSGAFTPQDAGAGLTWALHLSLVRGDIRRDSPEGQRVRDRLCEHLAASLQVSLASGGNGADEKPFIEQNNCPQ